MKIPVGLTILPMGFYTPQRLILSQSPLKLSFVTTNTKENMLASAMSRENIFSIWFIINKSNSKKLQLSPRLAMRMPRLSIRSSERRADIIGSSIRTLSELQSFQTLKIIPLSKANSPKM